MVGVLDFLTKHFLVLSTAITALLAGVTFLFITSYLSVFDSGLGLIFIIEYADILKFTLILLSIVAGVSSAIWGIVNNFYLYIIEKRTINKWVAVILISLFFGGFGFQMLYEYIHYADGRWYYTLMKLASYLLLIYWLFSIRQNVINWPNIPKLEILADIFWFFVSIYIFGATYGLSVKFSPKHYDIWVRDAQSLHDATIIMLLPHHSIFLVGQTVVTIPSANVLRIVHTTSTTPVD
jgi:hypothetical protein